MKFKILYSLNLMVLITALFFMYPNYRKSKEKPEIINKTVIGEVFKKESFTVTAVGDCTLGSDPNFGYARSFHDVTNQINHDYSYYFKNVLNITANDDLTIANLETTFTDATKKAIKTFTFKGPKSYADILPLGSVEAVNIANNHIYDFLEVGYQDTIKALDDVKVDYFGENVYEIFEKKGIRIGLLGYYELNNPNIYEDLDKGLEYMKQAKVNLIFVSFHWGIERNLVQSSTQTKLAHYAIDNGADLIIGHHPHVIQGIEKYKDKYIVYSLANFVFGGNQNPADKDTLIFQQTFNFENNKLVNTSINIIPASVSSIKERNNYQPLILEGSEKERVLTKILKNSVNLDYNK